jgi:hypothetical protein
MTGSQRSRHKTCDILLPVSSAKNAQGQSFSFPPALVSSRCLDRQATPPPKLSDLQLASYTAAENENITAVTFHPGIVDTNMATDF